MTLKNTLWVERYRPKTISDYVFTDTRQQETIQGWIDAQSIPNILLSGEPGTGKSSLAKVLMNELNIHEFDRLELNASRDNGVDVVRNQIHGFCQTMPFGKMKIILLDEADYASAEFQAALRHEMEANSSTVRFILTCNYQHKIIPALRESRCHKFHIESPDRTEFTARAATVLLTEEIDFDLDTLEAYVNASYPDLRKCLNSLQVNSQSGKLQPPKEQGNNEDELLTEATNNFKSGAVLAGRETLLRYLALHPTSIESIYRWFYNNLDLWAKTNEQKDAAILVIRNGLATLPMVGIPEIALSATVIELVNI